MIKYKLYNAQRYLHRWLTKSINLEIHDTYKNQISDYRGIEGLSTVHCMHNFEVHPEVALPAKEILILDSKHSYFFLRHPRVPSMEIVHLHA